MEGPTPVSALIHAATMVTAGVYLIVRSGPVFDLAPHAQTAVVVVGAVTLLFGAVIGCAKDDIKKALAASTMSQIGYMMLAAGLGPVGYAFAIFHLITHGFFKANMFLGAGSVIHAMSDEQDMRKMGGIWRLIPVTYAMMWIGSLALAGIPFFAGYYSKDAIMEAAFASGSAIGMYGFVMTMIAAFLTAFYSRRLTILTFHGKPQANDRVMAHVHESPLIMTIPLGVLAIGALFSGKARVVQEAKSGGRTFWRLRAGGFASKDEARRFCAALIAEGVDCIPATAK